MPEDKTEQKQKQRQRQILQYLKVWKYLSCDFLLLFRWKRAENGLHIRICATIETALSLIVRKYGEKADHYRSILLSEYPWERITNISSYTLLQNAPGKKLKVAVEGEERRIEAQLEIFINQ